MFPAFFRPGSAVASPGRLASPGVRPRAFSNFLSGCGFPNINDGDEIVDLIPYGSHLILFSTGRGSVVGSAIAPVITVFANSDPYRHMREDVDVDAGRILEGRATLDEVGREISRRVREVAAGQRTVSEALGRQEFTLTSKSFGPLGPACPPR